MLNWHWEYRDFVMASLKAQGSARWFQEIQYSYVQGYERILGRF